MTILGGKKSEEWYRRDTLQPVVTSTLSLRTSGQRQGGSSFPLAPRIQFLGPE